jgi:prolyl-tRNA synthetase
MRTSRFFLSTLKEAPADAEVISHQLMLRAGMIKRLAGGIYTWMPIGLRVVRKVEQIVRDEMDRAGAIELSMPAVQPAELWQESGRWEKYGPELLRCKDRHQRDFVIGPTHEEVITDVVRKEVKSYRQLPLHFYQVQVKFRDEIRPRFGVMRGREFLMKDGYSFHSSFDDLQREYRNMFDTYTRIFTRLGLKFRAVAADTGSIGGTGSHEFHVLADSGEDALAYCPDSDFAANVELAEALAAGGSRPPGTAAMSKVATPGRTRCEDVAELLDIHGEQDGQGDRRRSEFSGRWSWAVCHDPAARRPQSERAQGTEDPRRVPLRARRRDRRSLGCQPGYIGPVGVVGFPVHADRSVAVMSDFVCGANEAGFHLTGVNFRAMSPSRRGRRFAECRCRRPVARRPGPAGALSWHRGRPHLPVAYQVRRGAEMQLS